MILTRIEIENFKQYRGEHEIEIPALATIGVIGENGTGKTTLFEAIEWCLYSPRTIRNEDVRPRGEGGTSVVRVFLESLDGVERYAVERVLKRTPSATIYRFDESGDAEPIVNGTRQVSDYVASRLIGLSHTAFTATFFTRQKELHLFGDESPAKRREHIGRMLGLETIRTAQQAITADRSKALAEARALHATYEREAEGRDLAAELAAAAARIASSTAEHRLARERVAHAGIFASDATSILIKVQERRDQHAKLVAEIGKTEQEQRHRTTRLSQIALDLERLETEARHRVELEPVAAQLPSLQSTHAQQERNRARFQLKLQAQRDHADAELQRRDMNASVRDVVTGVSTSLQLPAGWIWTSDDNLNLLAGIDRLLKIADGANADGARNRLQELRTTQDLAKRLTKAEEDLTRYQAARDEIERKLAELVSSGDARADLTRLNVAREDLIKQRAQADSDVTAAELERDRTSRLVGNIRNQQFGDACPTCGRPFSNEDASLVIGSLEAKIEALTQQIVERKAAGGAIEVRMRALVAEQDAVQQRIAAQVKLEQRIENSVGVIANQQDTVTASRADLQRLLERLGRTSSATESDILAAEAEASLAQALANTSRILLSQRQTVMALEGRMTRAEAVIAEHRDVEFDEAAFQELAQSLRKAEQASTSIAHIDRLLARQPELIQERASLIHHEQRTAELLARLEADRVALGYSEPEYLEAQKSLDSARAAERTAVEIAHRAERELQKAQFARETIEREQQRLQDLARAGDERQREADTLALMVKEFVEFERYAASRKLPVLADITSQLVSAVTDGAYDRVEFDQDFGLVVSDGGITNETYGIETFSGGERDAITLAARIALSHMIGRGATNPPGFLVLDEVFGSLDSDRRARLMDLLGSITNQFDELRQIFIISHVDDVRTSPVLDELWRVEATDEGSSRITALPAGSEIETL